MILFLRSPLSPTMRLPTSTVLVLATSVQAIVVSRDDLNSSHPAPPPPSGGNLTNPPDYLVTSDFDVQSVVSNVQPLPLVLL